MKKTVTLHLEKETKGAIRYAEDVEFADATFPIIYIRKSAIPEGTPIPDAITVTIDTEVAKTP